MSVEPPVPDGWYVLRKLEGIEQGLERERLSDPTPRAHVVDGEPNRVVDVGAVGRVFDSELIAARWDGRLHWLGPWWALIFSMCCYGIPSLGMLVYMVGLLLSGTTAPSVWFGTAFSAAMCGLALIPVRRVVLVRTLLRQIDRGTALLLVADDDPLPPPVWKYT